VRPPTSRLGRYLDLYDCPELDELPEENELRIAVVGLGKLGSVLAAVYAAAGHEVVGVDVNSSLVESLNQGMAPFLEPGLQELITQAGSRLTATTDITLAITDAEASYLILPTPSTQDGTFSNEFLISALKDLGRALRPLRRRHTVVICSTVMPGACAGVLTSVLEDASGKRVGQDLGLVYSPEFIALGSVVHNMQNPDAILIGESDAQAGEVAEKNALSIAQNVPVVHRMNLVNAEIVKISINTFVTTKISFANMLGEICDHLPGGDVDVVTQAVGADSRIGVKYLKGALGYGGPCFPRDNIALSALADSLGVDAAIPRATDAVNDRQVQRIVELVTANTHSLASVAVLGLSYKPDTPVCERSQGIEIANKLQGSGFQVTVYDPEANSTARSALDPSISVAANLEDAVAPSATVIIATAWPQFGKLSAGVLGEKYVLDPWGMLPAFLGAARPGQLLSKGSTPEMDGSRA